MTTINFTMTVISRVHADKEASEPKGSNWELVKANGRASFSSTITEKYRETHISGVSSRHTEPKDDNELDMRIYFGVSSGSYRSVPLVSGT